MSLVFPSKDLGKQCRLRSVVAFWDILSWSALFAERKLFDLLLYVQGKQLRSCQDN